MWRYQVKRAIRNRLCRVAPSVYERYLSHLARRVPSAKVMGRVDLAEIVSRYYLEEYRSQVDEVMEGTVTLFQRSVAFGAPDAIDWHHAIEDETDLHLWRMKLGHMGFVAPLIDSENARHGEAVTKILEGFRCRSRFDVPGCFSSYWFPYSVSHRILALLSSLVVSASRRRVPESVERIVLDRVRADVAFVLANIEHELNNNHLERNLAALCFFMEFADERDPRLCARLDADVRGLIDDTLLADGMQVERSSMYQALTVMALRIFESSAVLSAETREIAREASVRATRAWALMSHPDGEIALFNDSWFGEVPEPEKMCPPVASVGLSILKSAGYARIERGHFFLLFDAGPIGPAWNPAHGHADFLSMELDVFGERFLVDPGTFQYSTGPRRAAERSAQSHNGPCWSAVYPVEYLGCFKVGRQAAAEIVKAVDGPLESEVRGQLEISEGVLARTVLVSQDRVAITDEWMSGRGEAQVRLLVSGSWRLEHWNETSATFASPRGNVRIVTRAGRIASVRPGQWACRYLESRAATVLELVPPVGHGDKRLAHWEVAAVPRVEN